MKKIDLYKRAKNGKIQIWSISVEPQENDFNKTKIIKSSGYLGMKITTNITVISKGCNIGKANEKTSFALAMTKAKKAFKDHLDDNWHLSIDSIDDTNPNVKPMLAQPMSFRRLKFPCYIQPKMNGVRVTSYRHLNDPTIWSRERNEYSALIEIKDNIEKYFGNLSPDGEGYSPDLTFQEITSAVKKRNDNTPKLKLWVYDLAIPDLDYTSRKDIISKIFKDNADKGINDYFHEVTTILCNSMDELKFYHEKWVLDGFEGIIIRDINGDYKFNERSYYLMKYKSFQDEEFEVIGFTSEVWHDTLNDKFRTLVIWKCITDEGKEFDARPAGSFLKREEAYLIAETKIGKGGTVKFQNYSDDGVPIFPVFVGFRDYE